MRGVERGYLEHKQEFIKSSQTWDTWHGKHSKERRGIITVNISSTNRGLNQHKRPPQIRQTNQRTY